ncbi:hypothetical protein [Acetobacter orleanensis]|uniref:Uncharacterized protein n=1 Tax=Acetobacter orleanensis TaxID=104099 RepID=A0A4Y3TMM7_9PROT|nr:hypothetical protein [Acetobacter orleanensis]KXV62880.1 hypothetical protein AD949_09000 [Acetobacter orleanensis]PCD80656.1 hypothetical protein CO710_02730 [Acetobacter orleanensis]GAN68003.1 hypothetical protein Abol_014_054 [Acetobacter orleanensis JCM 7639]GBR27376.1 hypothetical protein AA0473_1418 [Acetobacter orleanensis NRIC 0473]GEB82075.1 hypothetical protein AOR01nite_05520 [Acetobacter orleanensis]
MNGADTPVTPTSTEDTPATPGWVEESLDRILASLPVTADKLAPFRASYLDCLAGCGRTTDLDQAHDACRQGFLRAVKDGLELDASTLRTLEQQLEQLELSISSDI